MVFDVVGNLIESDDGGVYCYIDLCLNIGDWILINGNFQVLEFYDGVYDDNLGVVVGGFQDNGMLMQVEFNDQEYFFFVGGDGGDVVIDDMMIDGILICYMSVQGLQVFNCFFWDEDNNFFGFLFVGFVLVLGSNLIVGQFLILVEFNVVDLMCVIIGGGNLVYEFFDQGDMIYEIGFGVVINGMGFDVIGYGYLGNLDFLIVGVGFDVYICFGSVFDLLVLSMMYLGVNGVLDIVIDQDMGVMFVVIGNEVFWMDDEGVMWIDIMSNILLFLLVVLWIIIYVENIMGDVLVVGVFNGIYVVFESEGFVIWYWFGWNLLNVFIFDVDYSDVDKCVVVYILGCGMWCFFSCLIR